jgi:ubiquinone/menaquinone biosynthesis C-methylase UbiE
LKNLFKIQNLYQAITAKNLSTHKKLSIIKSTYNIMEQNKNNQLLKIDLILKKIKISETMRVADCGCGSIGYFTFILSNLVGLNGLVYAIDILKESLENIAKKAKEEQRHNIKTIWSDLEILNAAKINPASIDMVLLINILHQSKKKLNILREINRLVKRNGKILIIEWGRGLPQFGPPQKDRIEEDQLTTLINNLGLRLDESFIAGPSHYGLIITKI